MGNSVTVIKVHLGEGVSYYKPPMRVIDILAEHPDYVVVSKTKWRRKILSSDVSLQPGRNYYLVSPDNLFSATADSQIPADDSLSYCSQGCGKFYRYGRISFASTKSLLTMLARKRKRSQSKPSVAIRNLRAGPRYGRKAAIIAKENCTEASKLVTSLFSDSPAGALIVSGKRLCLNSDQEAEVCSETLDRTECSSPEFLPLGHGMVARVEEKSSSKSRKGSSRFSANACSELDSKESSSCIPWKSLKKVEEGEIVSGALSKEKWLEDMIRGAENQWKRIKLQQGFTMEGAECKELQRCLEPNLWRQCLPSGHGSMLTPGPKEAHDYLDYSQSLNPESSGRRQSECFDLAVDNRDHCQSVSRQDHRDRKRVARKASQSEIEEAEHLELDEKDGDSKHPLWLKMDEIERQFLMRPSPSASPPIPQSSLQKLPRMDHALSRPGSLNFSRVDRG